MDISPTPTRHHVHITHRTPRTGMAQRTQGLTHMHAVGASRRSMRQQAEKYDRAHIHLLAFEFDPLGPAMTKPPPGSGRGDVEGANIGVQEPTHLPVSTAPPMDAFTAATPEPARTGAITGGLATASTAAVIAPMEENRGKQTTEGISASAALQFSTKKIGTEDHTMATDHATTNTAPATTAAATCKTTAEAEEEEPPLSELFRIEPSRDTHAKKAQVESLPLVLVDVRVVD